MSDFIEFRFKLYTGSDARLLERIKEQANGTAENNAARFLMRHWYENERQGSLPQLRQTSAPQLGQDDQDLETALSAIDDAWE